MPPSIAIYNYKGGVGKSTVSTNLADVAAATLPSCVVDCDPQCTSSFYMLGIPEAVRLMTQNQSVKKLFDWVFTNEPLPRSGEQIAVQPPGWRAKLICGNMSLTDLEMEMILRGVGPDVRVWRSLYGLNYDEMNMWPIIDCSPSYSFFTIAATSCTRGGIYIPVTTDEDSLYGINLAARALAKIRSFNMDFVLGPTKIRGVICNRVKANMARPLLNALNYVIDQARSAFPESFHENFKILNTMLPEDTMMPSVRASRKSAISLAPNGLSAKAYKELFIEILELAGGT